MEKADLASNYALSFLGRPYLWGGDDPMEGFDCSGLVQEILESIGFDPDGDQTAQSLYEYFALHGTNIGIPQRGALAFYGKEIKKITHVAFCINSFQIIEAGGGGSATINIKEASRQNAFVRIRPIS